MKYIILLESWFRGGDLTPTDIYDFYAMTLEPHLFEHEINEFAKRLYDKLDKVIKLRVIWGVFLDYGQFPSKDHFVECGGDPKIWDKVYNALKKEGQIVDIKDKSYKEGLYAAKLSDSHNTDKISNILLNIDINIDDLFKVLQRMGNSLIVSYGGVWHQIWEKFKMIGSKLKNDRVNYKQKMVVIDTLLNMFHHGEGIFIHLMKDKTPGAQEKHIQALNAKFIAEPEDWWDKVSEWVRVKINKERRRNGKPIIIYNPNRDPRIFTTNRYKISRWWKNIESIQDYLKNKRRFYWALPSLANFILDKEQINEMLSAIKDTRDLLSKSTVSRENIEKIKQDLDKAEKELKQLLKQNQ